MATDGKTLALLSYILGIFTTWLAPLIIWLIGRKDAGNHGHDLTESLNIGITRGVAGLAIIILAFIPKVGGILALLAWIITIVFVVFQIMGAIKVSKGENYTAPFALRFVKN